LYECIGTPFIVTIPATGCTYEELRYRILAHMRRFISNKGDGGRSMLLDATAQYSQSAGDDRLSNAFAIAGHSWYSYNISDAGDIIKDDEGMVPLENSGVISVDWTDDALGNLRDEQAEQQIDLDPSCKSGESEGGLTLKQCLEHFTATEVLSEQDTWYCSKCKQHVRAKKTLALWSVPRLLVVHLKRFSDEEGYGGREKVDTLVRFPLEGLDMGPYLRGGGISCAGSEAENNEAPIYDLYAVSNHYGGSGFGHYTAYGYAPGCREWHLFDDSSVSKVSPDQICSTAAYVLFYKLRTFDAKDPSP